MPLLAQIAVFGIPGLCIYYGIYYGVPKLREKGAPLLPSFFFFMWAPLFALLPLALLAYLWVEGGTLTFSAITDRFRFVSLSRRDWFG